MEQKQVAKVLEFAQSEVYAADIDGSRSAKVADRIHRARAKTKSGRKNSYATMQEMASLFRWQCLSLEGEFLPNEVEQTFEFARDCVIVADDDPRYAAQLETDEVDLIEAQIKQQEADAKKREAEIKASAKEAEASRASSKANKQAK